MTLTETQANFVKFLADLWQREESFLDQKRAASATPVVTELSSACFLHQYEITRNNVWNDWKTGIPGQHGALGSHYSSLRQGLWWCHSLEEACMHYSWSNGSGAKFTQLSHDIKAAIHQGNTFLVRDLCLEIFKWGNVAKKEDDPSRIWVEDEALSGTLIASLRHATQLLQPSSTTSLAIFDGTRMLMNSAMTKIYAAVDASQTVVIYDGRVGAALGLLARMFLYTAQVSALPHDLAFLWGPMQGKGKANFRDPSDGRYKFRSLYAPSVSNQIRANVSRMTNCVLEALSGTLGAHQNGKVSLRDIEKALFMIGYRVR